MGFDLVWFDLIWALEENTNREKVDLIWFDLHGLRYKHLQPLGMVLKNPRAHSLNHASKSSFNILCTYGLNIKTCDYYVELQQFEFKIEKHILIAWIWMVSTAFD